MPVSTLKVGVARHETFHLRDGWLYKGLNSLSEDTSALNQVGVHHSLGLGTNMLKSMVYWMQASGLVKQRIKTTSMPIGFKLTEFAIELMDNDPFLEDPATLWLLHIGLVTNKDLATFWYWALTLQFRRHSAIHQSVTVKTKPIQSSKLFLASHTLQNKDSNYK